MSRIKEYTGINDIDFDIRYEEYNMKISCIVIKNNRDNTGKSILSVITKKGDCDERWVNKNVL